MEYMARIPDFVQRGKTLYALANSTDQFISTYNDDINLLSEIQGTYEDVKALLSHVANTLFEVQQAGRAGGWEPGSASYLDPISQTYAAYQRLYGLVLVVGIIVNVVLSALSQYTLSLTILPNLQAECEGFVQGILSIRENIAQYKPIGSNCLQLFLSVAWAGTGDIVLRKEIQGIVRRYEEEGVMYKMIGEVGDPRMEIEKHLKLLIREAY
jgi:hypothetical protein